MTTEERQQKAQEHQQQAADMAACIARTFLGSPDGKRTLGYIRQRFGLERMAFVNQAGRYDPIAAAIRDGERRVVAELEAALKVSNPAAWADSLHHGSPT